MKRIPEYMFFFLILTLTFFSTFASDNPETPKPGWKAGVARTVITPGQSMWMAGFASRNHASEGTMHDLFAKALILEDEKGQRAVIITSDLLGFPKGISDRIRDRIQSKYGLSRAQVLLSSSHTHSGPVLQNALYDVYPLDNKELEKIDQYSKKLEDQLLNLVGKAIEMLKPAKVFALNGVTRFQVNRRTNAEPSLIQQYGLNGPNDYAVPVIKVENESGELMAIAFGYACHPTVLSIYKWSGDYAGFAQLELEKAHPGVTAMFFQGAGSDMNALPRNTVELAQQYGKELASAVERTLTDTMKILNPLLTTSYSEVELELNIAPTDKELIKIAESSSAYQKRWALRMLEKKKKGEPFMASYPYPVQVWRLGEQTMINLGGELVVDYSIQLKRIFGQNIFVLGYCNDVMSYIPSVRVLREGGYEGASAQAVYGLHGSWKASIEVSVLSEVLKLADQVGVPIPGSKIFEN
jgi:neutral ceramidase